MTPGQRNAAIKANALGHILHIGTNLLAQIGHFVDEGNLHGEEGVGGIFNQLGALAAGEHDGTGKA
jgi:hypothetical protein